MTYTAESFHVRAAVVACQRMSIEGEVATQYYAPHAELGFPEGMSWAELARAIYDAPDNVASVDSLSEAPYRLLLGTADDASGIGWIDVSEDDDAKAEEPDLVSEYLG